MRLALWRVVGVLLASGRATAQTAEPLERVGIVINIPAYRLDVYDGGGTLLSFPVAVGMRKYKTPTGSYALSEIIWNPWWIPPESEWAAKDTVTPPGPTNPMGRVKLQLGSLLYAHGTPFPKTVGHAASHGCLRMRNEDAIELATFVQAVAGVPMDTATRDTLTTLTRQTRHVDLPLSLPVEIVYRVAEVRDSVLMMYPDVYRRRRGQVVNEAMQALAAARYDTSLIDRSRVARMASKATRAAALVPIASLVKGPNPR